MSKTKTKRARRELKREGDRKIMAHHRKIAKAAETKAASTTTTTKNKPPAAASAAAAAKKKTNKNKKQPATSTPTPLAPTTTTTTTTTPPQPPTAQPQPSQQTSQRPKIPFGPYDHILLVGEGDFSFTRSLAIEHGCANVVGTSYDTEEEVLAKYPRFAAIKEELASLTPPVPLYHGIDATKVGGIKALRCRRDDGEEVDGGDEEGDDGEAKGKRQGWDTIVFMFPHTGGLSTDQNRQVRANQHLLVSFFKSCLDTPTQKHRLALLQHQRQQSLSTTTPKKPLPPPFLRPNGHIITTLFDTPPYTLWNIRDLARHVGLKPLVSWQFDPEQYPGYSHVRTLGALENPGWRAEERRARMYVFEKGVGWLVADEEEEEELRRMGRRGRGGALGGQGGEV
ncbi:hypothetical protein GMOD_00008617 [Pyrenophora seminiperda CCB06]|uniref:25S rRNA (uridine-N(3))-methyltransferase BMT5-like domain-containing protein n=1 Tax=Pyrenophora seminiperda CCB06 TaxID=1302712 RepID=A0A3M7M921_9PLEO|nr:hypothetical protein GMOD_00008617 [Pyrenophora seminiperda CCB06]